MPCVFPLSNMRCWHFGLSASLLVLRPSIRTEKYLYKHAYDITLKGSCEGMELVFEAMILHCKAILGWGQLGRIR